MDKPAPMGIGSARSVLAIFGFVTLMLFGEHEAVAAPLAKVCEDLSAELARGWHTTSTSTPRVLLSPVDGESKDPTASALLAAMSKALVRQSGLTLLERDVSELALQADAPSGMGLDAIRERTGATGADAVVHLTLTRSGSSLHVQASLAAVGTGRVVATATASFSDTDVAGSVAGGAFDGSGIDSAKGSVPPRSLDIEMRRLADHIALSLQKKGGDVRYQRFAVLRFDEVGDETKSHSLGLLVASELSTLLVRDHGLLMVERGQLDRIISELALAQTGLIDPGSAAQVGKLAGADRLIVGSVTAAGDRYVIDARAVEVASGQVLVAEQGHVPAADLVALSAEAVVLRTPSGAIYRSILMPGWGQFYNREPVKGAAFVLAEIIAGGLAIGFHVMGNRSEDRYRDLVAGADFEAASRDANTNYSRRNGALLALGALHLINIADAAITAFVFDSQAGGGGQ